MERAMGTVGPMTRTMMLAGNAPNADFPWAATYATVILGYMPHAYHRGQSPNSVWTGMSRMPISSRLMRAGPLFCLCFPSVYPQERRKLENRSRPAVYLGIDNHSAYIVRDIHSGTIYYTADVTFYPNSYPYRMNVSKSPNGDILSDMEEIHAAQDDLQIVPASPAQPPATLQLPASDGRVANAARARSSRRGDFVRQQGGPVLRSQPEQSLISVEAAANRMAADVNVCEHKYQAGADVVGEGAICYAQSSQSATNTDTMAEDPAEEADPSSYDEAMTAHDAKQWAEANAKELHSHLHTHKTVQWVKYEPWMKVYKSRPVYKRKRDHDGKVVRHKARFTIAAYKRTMREGIDYQLSRQVRQRRDVDYSASHHLDSGPKQLANLTN